MLTQHEQQKHQIYVESVQLPVSEIGEIEKRVTSGVNEIADVVSDAQCTSQDPLQLDGNFLSLIFACNRFR